MKRKILSIFVCLALLMSFCTFIPTGVVAAAPNYLSVYVKYPNWPDPVLVHAYTPAETAQLPASVLYYKGWGTTNLIHAKGSGFTLTALINDLRKYDPNISFGTGASLNITASDGFTANYTYEYLYGSPRYYFPNLINTPPSNNNISGASPVDAMFAITSSTNKSNPTVSKDALDLQTMSDSNSYWFFLGQTETEAINAIPTATL